MAGGFSSGGPPASDLFKFTASSGEWTFVAGVPTVFAAATTEQGVGVPIAGNFSGPGFRMGMAWSVRTYSSTAQQPQQGEQGRSAWAPDSLGLCRHCTLILPARGRKASCLSSAGSAVG